jgi:hypothetical protein
MELLRTPRLRLGMSDEGTTNRWFGLTSRQFRKTLTADGQGAPWSGL